MLRVSYLLAGCWAVSIVLTSAGPLSAEISRREASRLGVDVVTLKQGGDVRGVIVDKTGQLSLTMAVRRDWLNAHQPGLLKTSTLSDGDKAAINRDLVDRIDHWLVELGGADAGNGPVVTPQEKLRQTRLSQDQVELLRVIQEERATYQEYVDDPLKLPAGEGDADARREAYRQLIRRLDDWAAEVEGKPKPAPSKRASHEARQQNREELIRILLKERETYQQAIDTPAAITDDASPFVRVVLSRQDVRLVFAQAPARRQLGLAALLADLPNVERLTIDKLQRGLEKAGVDAKSPVDPTELLGHITPQNDREWAARRALYEYQFLDRIEFQGTGSLIIQTGENAPPPQLADLLQGAIDQQRNLALGDLLDEPIFTGLDFGGLGRKSNGDWKQKAIRAAKKARVNGFRVTRMTPNIQRRETLVEDQFFAKMPNGQWEPIWTDRRTETAANADPQDIDRIKQDPQLKQALDLVEGLGLGNLDQLDMALQFGAATMHAQQAADDAFYEFRDRYSQRLSGPPLSW